MSLAVLESFGQWRWWMPGRCLGKLTAEELGLDIAADVSPLGWPHEHHTLKGRPLGIETVLTERWFKLWKHQPANSFDQWERLRLLYEGPKSDWWLPRHLEDREDDGDKEGDAKFFEPRDEGGRGRNLAMKRLVDLCVLAIVDNLRLEPFTISTSSTAASNLVEEVRGRIVMRAAWLGLNEEEGFAFALCGLSSIVLPQFNISPAGGDQILRAMSGWGGKIVQHIDLRGSNQLPPDFATCLLSQCTNIQELNLVGCRWNASPVPRTVQSLAIDTACLKRSDTLALILKECKEGLLEIQIHLGPHGFRLFIEDVAEYIMKPLPKLRSCMVEVKPSTPEVPATFASPTLAHLELSILDTEVNPIFRTLELNDTRKRFPELKCLKILSHALQVQVHLAGLDEFLIDIRDEISPNIGDWLSTDGLRRVELRAGGNYIGNEVKELVNPTLQELRVVNGTGTFWRWPLRQVALESLHTLIVRLISITEPALHCLLQGCKALQYLSLHGVKIGKLELWQRRLTKVHLEDSQISEIVFGQDTAKSIRELVLVKLKGLADGDGLSVLNGLTSLRKLWLEELTPYQRLELVEMNGLREVVIHNGCSGCPLIAGSKIGDMGIVLAKETNENEVNEMMQNIGTNCPSLRRFALHTSTTPELDRVKLVHRADDKWEWMRKLLCLELDGLELDENLAKILVGLCDDGKEGNNELLCLVLGGTATNESVQTIVQGSKRLQYLHLNVTLSDDNHVVLSSRTIRHLLIGERSNVQLSFCPRLEVLEVLGKYTIASDCAPFTNLHILCGLVTTEMITNAQFPNLLHFHPSRMWRHGSQEKDYAAAISLDNLRNVTFLEPNNINSFEISNCPRLSSVHHTVPIRFRDRTRIRSGQDRSPRVSGFYTAPRDTSHHVTADIGSSTVRVGAAPTGCASHHLMLSKNPAIVGTPRFPTCMLGVPRKTLFGNLCSFSRGAMEIKWPMKRNGSIGDMDSWEQLLRHTLKNDTRISPDSVTLLYCVNNRVSKPTSIAILERLFESQNFQAVQFALSGLCALYSQNLFTGCIVESGHSSTSVTPITEGCVRSGTILEANLGGRDVTRELRRLVRIHDGYDFSASTALKLRSQELKENLCFVEPERCDREWSHSEKLREWTLPDGQMLLLDEKVFARANEVLFDPKDFDIDQTSVQELVVKAIRNCDIDNRRGQWQRMVVCGGNAETKGFTDRLRNEILAKQTHVKPFLNLETQLADSHTKCQDVVWRGGAVLAASSSFWPMYITCNEYDEYGPHALLNRVRWWTTPGFE